jgi:hypothetical protein
MMMIASPSPAIRKSSAVATKENTVEIRRRTGGTGLNDIFIGIFGIAFLLSVSMGILHATVFSPPEDGIPQTAIHVAMAEFKVHGVNGVGVGGHRKKKASSHQKNEPLKQPQQQQQQQQRGHLDELDHADAHLNHPAEVNAGDPVLSYLSCDKYGGPPNEYAQEMVYWSDIPSDAAFVSPFHTMTQESERKYMTFEPDGGGWNNIRMAMASVSILDYIYIS